MKVEFRRSFTKDLKDIKNQDLLKRVQARVELVEKAQTLQEIDNLRKLRGSDRYYRVRVGDYRIGLIVEGDKVIFVRFLHRRDMYRNFP